LVPVRRTEIIGHSGFEKPRFGGVFYLIL